MLPNKKTKKTMIIARIYDGCSSEHLEESYAFESIKDFYDKQKKFIKEVCEEYFEDDGKMTIEYVSDEMKALDGLNILFDGEPSSDYVIDFLVPRKM
jgi:hypothetical protein